MTEQQEREAFEAWAGREYRHAYEVTLQDYEHGWRAWKARAALSAKANPAPGYCPHCKQYSIEEPLPAPAPEATPAQAQQAALHEIDIVHAAVAAMPHANPALADDLLSGFTMHTEMADVVAIYRAGMVAAKTEAKPLTEREIVRLWREPFDRKNEDSWFVEFARAIERACAEAWGVKLAGIGASTGGKP